MARYIDAEELQEEIKSLSVMLGGNNVFKTAKESVLRIIANNPQPMLWKWYIVPIVSILLFMIIIVCILDTKQMIMTFALAEKGRYK